ncbi:MAG: hypothetical protein R2770_00950 [Acidimicrobiales bacterium]
MDRSDPALRECVGYRDPHRCLEDLEDLESFGAEHLVKRVDELAATVTNERSGVFETFAVADEQVSRGLCGPFSGWVGGDAGEDHLSGAHFDEEQDVLAAQERSVDGEQVAGQCSELLDAISATSREHREIDF